jgi:hypothetical protein
MIVKWVTTADLPLQILFLIVPFNTEFQSSDYNRKKLILTIIKSEEK